MMICTGGVQVHSEYGTNDDGYTGGVMMMICTGGVQIHSEYGTDDDGCTRGVMMLSRLVPRVRGHGG